MPFGKDSKDPQTNGPNHDEENDNQNGDLPSLGVLAGPQIEPVAAIWRREPEILNKHGVEKPLSTVSYRYCSS